MNPVSVVAMKKVKVMMIGADGRDLTLVRHRKRGEAELRYHWLEKASFSNSAAVRILLTLVPVALVRAAATRAIVALPCSGNLVRLHDHRHHQQQQVHLAVLSLRLLLDKALHKGGASKLLFLMTIATKTAMTMTSNSYLRLGLLNPGVQLHLAAAAATAPRPSTSQRLRVEWLRLLQLAQRRVPLLLLLEPLLAPLPSGTSDRETLHTGLLGRRLHLVGQALYRLEEPICHEKMRKRPTLQSGNGWSQAMRATQHLRASLIASPMVAIQVAAAARMATAARQAMRATTRPAAAPAAVAVTATRRHTPTSGLLAVLRTQRFSAHRPVAFCFCVANAAL